MVALIKPTHDSILETALYWAVRKYEGDWRNEGDAAAAGLDPYEICEGEGNLLVYGGASLIWEFALGNGTVTAGQAKTYFNSAQAALGTGDSSTAAAATQTDLQAAAGTTHQLRKAMDSSPTQYPTHTDGTSSGNASAVFQSTWGSSEGNYTAGWLEWGLFNSSTAATGRMFSRKVFSTSPGVKGAGTSWTLQVTLTAA